ncbi:MAG: HDOD domain-containing protein [Armatimonadetes bacterium]|nr:HDOD domain-containing protein [Armatimonadota bacterium]
MARTPLLGEILIAQGTLSREEMALLLRLQQTILPQRLGEILLAAGRVSPKALEAALQAQAAQPDPTPPLVRLLPAVQRLGEMLCQQGQITEPQLAAALRLQADILPQTPLGAILVSTGLITETALEASLQSQEAMIHSPAGGDGLPVAAAAFSPEADTGGPPWWPHCQASLSRTRTVAESLCQPAKALESLLHADPPLEAAVMAMAEKSGDRPREMMNSIRAAVAWMGLDAVRGMALAASLEEELPSAIRGETARRFWSHSFAVAVTARHLAPPAFPGLPDRAFAAGLLHEIGWRLLARYDPHAWEACRAETVAQRESSLPFTLGVRLLEGWAVPAPVVDALRRSPLPCAVSGPEPSLGALLGNADVQVFEAGIAPRSDRTDEPPPVRHTAISFRIQQAGKTASRWFPEEAEAAAFPPGEAGPGKTADPDFWAA